jgi:hypothetical protein
MMEVSDGNNTSKHSNRRGVGRGSRGQLVGFECKMIFFKSLSEIGWNDENE